MTLREAINSAIDEEMERDPSVFIIGASADHHDNLFPLVPCALIAVSNTRFE